MKLRQILCDDCKEKIRRAEAVYKKGRRLKINEIRKQVSGKIKINKK